jgi:hypothetical protein
MMRKQLVNQELQIEMDALYRVVMQACDLGKFSGGHAVHTPRTIVEPILTNVSGQEYLVLFNIEFVVGLVYTNKVDPRMITFYSDHSNKSAIARKLGVKYFENLNSITMKSRPVMLINPPYTNGEQDASEIYTQIISDCIDKFDPIAIGGVTPENLINGGQKKQKLREKILKKYGLKDLRFLDQKRDWNGKISVDTVFWIVEESYQGPTTVLSRHANAPYTVTGQLTEYIDGANQQVHDWIQQIQTVDKIKLRLAKKTGRRGNQIKISKDGADNFVIEKGFEHDSHNTEWRVAFGYMRCNTCAIVPPSVSVPGKYRYINFGSSEDNARKFAAYMLSEPVRFIMKLVYTSRTLDNPQLSYVPKLDMNKFKKITDAVLYKHWNTDPAVQSFINATVGGEVPF